MYLMELFLVQLIENNEHRQPVLGWLKYKSLTVTKKLNEHLHPHIEVCRYLFSVAEPQLLNISHEFSLREYSVHVWKVIETFVQKASHLQGQCFPLQKQAYNSSGSQLIHEGVFRQTGRMKRSLDGWKNLPASWETGWGSHSSPQNLDWKQRLVFEFGCFQGETSSSLNRQITAE